MAFYSQFVSFGGETFSTVCLFYLHVFFFISNLVAKGEGLVLAKKLSNLLSNLKGYIYKNSEKFTKMHLIRQFV